MSGPPRLPPPVGDYLRDAPPASPASWERHWIHLLALMLAWNTPRCRLPNDPKWLARRFGCSVPEFHERVESVLRKHFKCNGNFYSPKLLVDSPKLRGDTVSVPDKPLKLNVKVYREAHSVRSKSLKQKPFQSDTVSVPDKPLKSKDNIASNVQNVQSDPRKSLKLKDFQSDLSDPRKPLKTKDVSKRSPAPPPRAHGVISETPLQKKKEFPPCGPPPRKSGARKPADRTPEDTTDIPADPFLQALEEPPDDHRDQTDPRRADASKHGLDIPADPAPDFHHARSHDDLADPDHSADQDPADAVADTRAAVPKTGRRQQFPPDWRPDPTGLAFARRTLLDLRGVVPTDADIDAEIGACVDHHRGKGNVFSDLAAAWRTWVRGVYRFDGSSRPRPGSGPGGGRGGGRVLPRSSVDLAREIMAERERRGEG